MRISTFKISISVFAFVLASVFLYMGKKHQQETFDKLPKKQRIEEAIEQEFEATKDPALNEVPRQRLVAAKAYADRLRNNPSQRATISGISWDERGPSNVSGRTRAILVDAGDATGNTIFAGGVGGGLWQTTNALAGSPTWTNIGDQFANLAISCIYQDPANSDNIYAGTGEGWFNADAIRGLGIWKSADGGATWAQLASTNNSTFYYVQKIVVASNGDVFACTRDGGIQRSTNGGSTWSQTLGTSTGGASTNRAADIEIAANGDLYASTGIFTTDGIYKSTNGGTSWTKQAGGLPTSGYYRIELACAPSDANRVYAVYCGTNYDVSGIYRTDNGGTSWSSQTVPSALGMANYARGQAWYDLIAAVHPANSSRVFIGGIDILVTTNAGSSWSQISQWYGSGNQYVHADQHAMVFQSNNSNVMYYGNDGGIFRTTNSSATTPTISFIGTGFNVTQYYHADIHPGYGVNEYLAGAQDNGTQRYTSPGINATTEVTGGDGAFSHIDQDNPAIQISAYVYNQYRVTSNAWSSYTTRNFSSSTGRFINPTDYDSDQNVLYGANDANSYFRMTGVGSSNTMGSQSMTAFGGAEASHVKVSPNVPNQVYFGLDNGNVVRVSSAHNTSASGTVIRTGSGYVSCVEVEEGDENHILVTYSNYGVNSIFETTNGGSSWTSVEGNLPDMPIRWAIFIPGSSDSVMVATELGTWTTDNLNGTSTVWGASNTDFANVRVNALASRNSDRQIIAATHGRGLFSTDHFNQPPPPVTCNATITSFPYSESYESGLGDWVLASGNFLWTRNSGGTPSSGTGPSGAADGSFYMYMEVSSPNYPSLDAYFEGPCFDLTGANDADISFQYHMLGAPGTLRLQVSTDNGASWSANVWTISGDQGTNWVTANVDLSIYAGSVIKLRFHGTSGTTWQGDICVDDINVTTAGAAPLAVTIPTSSDVSCNGGNDGSATASATGGTSPYSYSWTNGASTATANGLAAGSYTVTVTDATSATASASVTISQPTAISASASGTDALCNGGNGSVNLTVSGGISPYTYSWSNGASTQDLASVGAGNYTVTITDANGCTAGSGATVNEPTAISASASATDAACNGGNGSVNLTVSGGTSPYTYSWSNGATTQDLSAVAAGTYNVTVTDDNGCTAGAGATVNEPTAILATTFASNAACNGGNGAVGLTVSGGTSPYTFSWSNGATTQNLTAVPAGTYTVTVTDNNGCTAGAGSTVNEPAALNLGIVGTDESAPGASDGAADLTVGGGTTPYSYSWSNAATTEDISGLSGGTYSVTVTDANGCTASSSVVINTLTSPLAVNITGSNDASCNGQADGDATATASGGTPPYSYSWTSGATTATATGLSAGSYTVTVTDAALGTASAAVTISEPSALSASASATDAACNGGNGSVDLTVGGGTAPYSYNWSNGATTEDLAAVAAGSYTATITDANGCVANAGATVNEPSALTAFASATGAACNGGNGSVDLTAGGGTLPYSYNWSNGATTEDLAAVAAGSYNVTVTDVNGCTVGTGATVNEPSALNLGIVGTDESAPGASDGSADLTVSGGTAGYTYSWSNGATTEDISGVVGGTYSVTVTDANGCTASSSVVINTIVPTGLNAEYGVVSAVGDSWQTINLQNTYNSMVVVATVNLPDQNTAPAVSRIQNAAGSSFQLRIQVPGASATSTYNVHYFVVEEGVYTQAADGITMEAVKFTSTITAENNNWAFEPRTYSNTYSSPVVLGQVMTYNDADWSVFWASENGNRLNPPSASSLSAGKNVSEDTDNTRSDETVGYIVFESGSGTVGGVTFVAGVGADAIAGPTNTVGYNYSLSGLTDASVAVLSTAGMDGGNGGWPVLFGANPVSATQMTLVFDEDQVGDSERSHTNEQVAYLVFENPTDPCASFAANATATDISCNGRADGSASATPVNGTGPFSYSWSNGGSTANISGLGAGTYTVTITDANSCTASASTSVSEPTALGASASATDAGCNGGSDGSVDLTVSGGTAPYNYNWSNGGTTEDISGLAAGSYSVTVTDANGCTAGANATVNEPSALTASASASDASCTGYSDGSIDLTAGGGTSPYSYNWSNGGTTEDIAGLSAGSYTVTVTDANGCTATAGASVGEPAGMSLSTSVTDVSCNGDTDGAVDLTVTNGVNPLSFSWSNSAITEDLSGVGAGNYDVTVTDGSGCTAATSANVGQPAVLSLSASVTDESTAGANDGAIDLTISGGSPAYGVSWTGPSGFSAGTEDISSLAPGNYDVAVLDANGCSANDSYTVNAGSSTPTITIEEGVATNIGDSWVTINTANTYTNMVVVATPVITSNTNASIVSRIQNAGSSSFQLRVQDPSGSAQSGISVHYVVVEAGVYDQATYGVTMEAVRTTSTITGSKTSWVEESRSYSNSYTNPVVIGQVMTYNDADWSVFWATGSSRTNPPSASSFHAGKMVGEDPDNTRANEDIGYIVIESGSGTIGSLSYDAALGSDIIRGLGNSASGYDYSSTISNISSAHLSAAGMDGADGGWPTLFGTTPVSTSQITLSFPEDVLGDSERNHTTEQVAYVVFGVAATGNQPISGIPGEIIETDPNAPQVRDIAQNIELFPNPTNGKLFLVMESTETQHAEVEIFDLKGRVVWKKSFELNDGSQKLEMEVNSLSDGFYILRLNSPQLTYTKRFIKR